MVQKELHFACMCLKFAFCVNVCMCLHFVYTVLYVCMCLNGCEFRLSDVCVCVCVCVCVRVCVVVVVVDWN